VEGVFDSIIHFLATGIPTVAIGGKTITSYNRDCVRLFGTESKTIMLDSDATSYAVRLAREFDMKLKLLPAGMDPADYYKGRIDNGSDD
jgi:hypothetical protein